MIKNLLTPRFSAMVLSIAFLALIDEPILAQYEFTSFTVVESIVPGGAGRSRIISATEERNHEDYVSINGKDGRNKSSRKDIRMETFEEAVEVHKSLEKTYQQSKLKIIKLPFTTLQERFNLILKHCANEFS